nr:MFS transporter [Gluconacetobacter tumulisoli]
MPATIVPGRMRLMMAGALLSVAIGSLDQGIVNTALPRIASGFSALPHLSWIVTAFMLTSTVTTPVYGALGDSMGRRRMLMTSLALFTGGSMLCGAAWSMNALILFRAVQGLGSGGLIALALSIVVDLVPRNRRGQVQGMFSAVMGVCGIAGPFLGGLITTILSWRWTFYINLPVGIIALGLVAMLPRDTRRAERFDWMGAVLMALATTALLILFSLDNRSGAGTQLGLLAATLVLGVAAVGWEVQTTTTPILAVDLFRNRTISISLAIVTLQVAAVSAVGVTLPLFFQLEMGMGAARSGVMLVPQTAAMIVASMVSGRILREGDRIRPILVGTQLAAAGATLAIGVCIRFAPGMLDLSACMILLGAAFGLSFPCIAGITQNAALHHQLTRATSLMMYLRWLGASAGIALCGRLLVAWLPRGAGAMGIDSLAAGGDASLVTAYRTGIIAIFLVNGAMFLLAAVLVRILPLARAGDAD